MVAVGFTKLKEKILNGEKTQTIRRYSEHWARLWPGVKLHLYWKLRTKNCELLLIRHLKHSIGPITFSEFTESMAVADGFNSLEEMQTAFREMYKDAETQEYIILVWKKTFTQQFLETVTEEIVIDEQTTLDEAMNLGTQPEDFTYDD